MRLYRSGRGELGVLSISLAPLLLAALGLLALLPGPQVAPAPHPHATLLVLGAAQYNGRPSPAFKRRLDHALSLYRAGGVALVVVSGGVGRGDHASEGAVGRAYLARLGVPPARLLAETRSHTTLENLEFSRPLLRGPVTLVTDEVHAPRALALARALGLDADVSSVRLSRPDPRYQLREKLALLAYTVLGVQDDRRR